MTFNLREAEASIERMGDISHSDAHAICTYLFPHHHGVQLAEVLDALTLLEDRHHRHLLPIERPDLPTDDAEEGEEMSMCKVVSDRPHVFMPGMDAECGSPRLGGQSRGDFKRQ